MVSDEDENSWAKAAEYAVLYGAAELAADLYEDERLARFEQQSADCAAELTAQGIADAFAGPMSVAPVAAGEDYLWVRPSTKTLGLIKTRSRQHPRSPRKLRPWRKQIGRANVCTPVTNPQL